MSDSIGLPKLHLEFINATAAALTRAKNGVAAVMVRDSKANGVYELADADAIPSALGEANRTYISRAFKGSSRGKPTKVVVVVFPTGADEDGALLKAALSLFTGKTFDYVAGPSDINEAEVTVLKDWVIAARKANPTIQAVLPNCAANDRGIINCTSTVFVGNTSFAPATYCSRIAGVLAGTPSTASCTYAELDEVTAVAPLNVEGKTEEEAQTAAIDAGQLIVIHDGVEAKIARGVNSYVTLQSGETDSLKKIKVTEGEGLVSYYSAKAINAGYRGVMVNSYDNKCVLIEELREMFGKMEKQGILLPGTSGAELDLEAQTKYLQDHDVDTSEMSEMEIKKANTGSWVFWMGGGEVADAMEDFEGRFFRKNFATQV